MNGWIILAGVAGLLIGIIVGLVVGAYYYAKGIVHMVDLGEIIYVDKKEREK